MKKAELTITDTKALTQKDLSKQRTIEQEAP
jgi:hypothetical protein